MSTRHLLAGDGNAALPVFLFSFFLVSSMSYLLVFQHIILLVRRLHLSLIPKEAALYSRIPGVAFIGMAAQLPLIAITAPLEKMKGINGRVIGNCIFWISFTLIGQPLAALLYFFAWQAKYGSVSKTPISQ